VTNRGNIYRPLKYGFELVLSPVDSIAQFVERDSARFVEYASPNSA
jgi:hypothetical protein